MTKTIKIYQKRSADGLNIFWTAQKKGFKGERLLKTRETTYPVKTGFYTQGREHNYISPTDAEFINKEVRQKSKKKMRSVS